MKSKRTVSPAKRDQKLRDQAAAANWDQFVATRNSIDDHLAAIKAKAILDAATIERLQGDGIHSCHNSCPRVACGLRRDLAQARIVIVAMRASLGHIKGSEALPKCCAVAVGAALRLADRALETKI